MSSLAYDAGTPETPSMVLSHIQSNQEVCESYWFMCTVVCNDSFTHHGTSTDSYLIESSGAFEIQGKEVELESLGPLKYVASGEYADVYTATPPLWGRDVAVKLMKEAHKRNQRVIDDIMFGKLLLGNFV